MLLFHYVRESVQGPTPYKNMEIKHTEGGKEGEGGREAKREKEGGREKEKERKKETEGAGERNKETEREEGKKGGRVELVRTLGFMASSSPPPLGNPQTEGND